MVKITSQRVASVGILLAATLLIPFRTASGQDCENVPIGSCGGITGVVSAVPPYEMAPGIWAMHTNDFQVTLTWSAASDINCGSDQGYYDPWANNSSWGSYRYKPADFWNSRTTTYTWYVYGSRYSDPDPIGCAWQFRVRGERSFVQGPFSETTVFIPGAVSAPSSVAATYSSGTVRLSWQAPSARTGENGATFPLQGYRIYRNKEGSNDDSLFATVEGTASSWVDSSVVSGNYYYTIYPFDQYGFGASHMESVNADTSSSSSSTKSGCGTGAGLALIPPVFFFVRGKVGGSKKSARTRSRVS